MKELSLKQKLSIIQTELIVPKSREMRGKTGKVMYRYRNLDDIFDSLKPINAKYGVFFTVEEDPTLCGAIIFRKSIATIHDCESDETISASSFVRENVTTEGFQAPEQRSGGSSSYSNKLAMSKLLLLDDNSDPDERLYSDDGIKVAAYCCPKSWGKLSGKTLKQIGSATVKAIIVKLNAKAELTEEDRQFLAAARI